MNTDKRRDKNHGKRGNKEMHTGMQIGGIDKPAVEAVGAVILQILTSGQDQQTIQEALDVLKSLAHGPENITISGATIGPISDEPYAKK